MYFFGGEGVKRSVYTVQSLTIYCNIYMQTLTFVNRLTYSYFRANPLVCIIA